MFSIINTISDMKRFYMIAAVAALLCGQIPAFAQTDEKESLDLDLTVLTTNIRLGVADDGENSWEFRKEAYAEVIAGVNADIIGTQEAYNFQKKFLEEKLPGYSSVGVAREDGKEEGEYSAIFYRNDRFRAVECGNFWLSETPEVPSKGWDAACIRIASWAFLEEISTGKRFFFVNTHLDHVGVVARREGVNLLCRKAHEIGGDCPMIITGDFNSSKESDDIKYVKSVGLIHAYDIAVRKTLNPSSYHGYHDYAELAKRIPAQFQPNIIDYIFISEGSCSYYEMLPQKSSDGKFISDHCPVMAKIKL